MKLLIHSQTSIVQWLVQIMAWNLLGTKPFLIIWTNVGLLLDWDWLHATDVSWYNHHASHKIYCSALVTTVKVGGYIRHMMQYCWPGWVMLVKMITTGNRYNVALSGIHGCEDMKETLSATVIHWTGKQIEHYNDVIMSMMASQITGVSIVCLTVCTGAYQRKHQSSASLTFVRGIHRWLVDSPHKGPVTRKMFPFDDVIISTKQTSFLSIQICSTLCTRRCIHASVN